MPNDRLTDTSQSIPEPCDTPYNPGGEDQAMVISQLGGRKVTENGKHDRNVRKY